MPTGPLLAAVTSAAVGSTVPPRAMELASRHRVAARRTTAMTAATAERITVTSLPVQVQEEEEEEVQREEERLGGLGLSS